MTGPQPPTRATADRGAPASRVLAVEHTYAEGTCLTGTRRADDLYALLRSHGWLYRRSVGDFRLQASQDRPAKHTAIERTATALRERGFTVEISIDQNARPVAEAEAERAVRADERADRLAGRAQRLRSQAADRQAAADRVFDSIPLGQPMLTDSSGYAADRNRRERARNNQSRAIDLNREAQRTDEAAQTAAGHMDARHAPATVANRIRDLDAELRRLDRARERDHVDDERREHVAAQLQYWRGVREEQIRDGVATDYGRDDFQPGDLVKMRGTLYVVIRSNQVSVTVPSPFGHTTGTLRFEHITDRLRVGDDRWPVQACLAVAQARTMAAPRAPHPAWQRLGERCRLYTDHTTPAGTRCAWAATPRPRTPRPTGRAPSGVPAPGPNRSDPPGRAGDRGGGIARQASTAGGVSRR